MLSYCVTHPDAIIRYKKSNIILEIHIDASYLSDPKSRSRSGIYFFLKEKLKQDQPMMNDNVINVVSTIICNEMSLASKAELVALYPNEKYGVVVWNTLEEMGHPHPEMNLLIENSTA